MISVYWVVLEISKLYFSYSVKSPMQDDVL